MDALELDPANDDAEALRARLRTQADEIEKQKAIIAECCFSDYFTPAFSRYFAFSVS